MGVHPGCPVLSDCRGVAGGSRERCLRNNLCLAFTACSYCCTCTLTKITVSSQVCDLGVCKAGMEDACGLVCDNPKAYCCYLVRRQRFITLEFWNGPNQEILARSLQVADLDKENEKTLRLGFYLDVARWGL